MNTKSIIFAGISFAVFFSGNLHAQTALTVNSEAVVSVRAGAVMFVNGGVQLEKNSELNNHGNIFLNVAANRTADFTDNSANAYSYGTGNIVFSGNGIQHVKSINTFGRVEINNNGLTLLSNIKADNWLLKKGRINTGTNYAVVLSSNANAIESGTSNKGFTSSWFNGNLRRYLTPAVVNNYQFPVGDQAKVFLCEMDNLSLRPLNRLNYIDAKFNYSHPQKLNTIQKENGKNYASLSNIGIWHLVPDISPTAGSYDLKLFVDQYASLPDNHFTVLNNSTSNLWVLPPGSTSPASYSKVTPDAYSYARRNNISTFNQFGIAAGTDDGYSNAFTVYPDPVTNNEFFIKTGNTLIKEVRLFTTENREVNVGSLQYLKNSFVKVLLPPSLPKAAYIVRVITENDIKISRIIIQ